MEHLKPTPANSSPLTPLSFLDRAATVYGDCVSVIYNQTQFTWSETSQRCHRVASSISSLFGIRRRDVVSVLSPNVPAMYELQFAVPMAGAVINSVNTRLDARTVSVLLKHSGSKLLFVDCALRSLAVEALSLLKPGDVKPVMVLIRDGYESEEVNALTGEFAMSYDDLVERGDPGFDWLMPETEWDPIALNYTSGTTSAPKGAVHCHRGIFLMTLDTLINWSVPKQAVYLWTLPMFHANGWCFPWGMAAVGGVNVCVRKFEAAAIFHLIEKHKVTHMCGAPVVLNMLSNSKDARPLKIPVKIMTAGASPPAAVLLRTEALGFEVSHGYGLTETAGLVVTCAWKPKWNRLPASEQARMKARQGVRSYCMTKMDVIDPATLSSAPRDGATVGEVVLRGGSVMMGYLKDPESTAKSISNGWFFTGDVGVMHEDGYLEIKDRSKDVIITGGENVSSVEVESVLFAHPEVNEAAVVARPDEFWGETPCAFVSLKAGVAKGPSDKEVMEYCRERMPHYMIPKTVAFMEELPKTATGKIQKFVLRELAMKMGPTQHRSRM
uniref:4-coumarate--CoA ligase n=1 Tax=Kalanchoe fedtschenkoi TaxID=63787 RepID=A0A7N0TNQ7_KALFE